MAGAAIIALRVPKAVQPLRALGWTDLERTFDANEELAALVVDLIEEVERLRGRR